ncbi:hypothetical protein A1O1_09160 [Capronia coronata CBS 617.96]|uniref:Uncharacterized protein n=1 Tax=Capronia coronata CBS 617.96 TaxID=1182541 RepID=W9XEV1_9EURO|nr:uncharacterized protein A1O1_09160 [Capronia coronata CBS 617.96]EXJ78758.1 hypothetical protein A1O1_09160 [Capronia coronata CBS 617.96]
MLTSTNPAVTAYKVFHLSQIKLDKECRRPTPDLHRIVAHAAIVDNIRRWSREVAEPSETVLVDSESDTDSDPFEDPIEDEDEDAVRLGEVAIYDDDDDETDYQYHQSESDTDHVHDIQLDPLQDSEDHESKSTIPSPNRRPPPPPTASLYKYKSQSWRQTRPILVKETAVEVDEDD